MKSAYWFCHLKKNLLFDIYYSRIKKGWHCFLMYHDMDERPVYQIGSVSRLIDVHPETIRGWENYGVIKVSRINNRRYFTQNDIKRLRFAQKMMGEGINLPALSRFLKFYPCWYNGVCPVCMHPTSNSKCGKLCWKEDETYCIQDVDKKQCSSCWVINGEGLE